MLLLFKFACVSVLIIHIGMMRRTKITQYDTIKLHFSVDCVLCADVFQSAAGAARTPPHWAYVDLISMNLLRAPHHCHWQPLWNAFDAYFSYVGVNSCSKREEKHSNEGGLMILSSMHVLYSDCLLSSASCWTPVKASTLCSMAPI